jgi:hypothetical protein
MEVQGPDVAVEGVFAWEIVPLNDKTGHPLPSELSQKAS